MWLWSGPLGMPCPLLFTRWRLQFFLIASLLLNHLLIFLGHHRVGKPFFFFFFFMDVVYDCSAYPELRSVHLYLWKSQCGFGASYFCWCLSFRKYYHVACKMLRNFFPPGCFPSTDHWSVFETSPFRGKSSILCVSFFLTSSFTSSTRDVHHEKNMQTFFLLVMVIKLVKVP